MTGTTIEFINKVEADGTVTPKITVENCLIAQNGSPAVRRPQLTIHLPRKFSGDVTNSWVNLEGHSYYVIGVTAKVSAMDKNKATEWDRYVVAERIC